MDPMQIILHFYPEDTPLRRLLVKHSEAVRDKALEILKNGVAEGPEPDPGIVAAGAMLHDIGIGQCHAPGILCTGNLPYIAHGITGARMLREYARETGTDLETFARICERHTGTGITAEEVRKQGLPIPEKDWLPETPEEKLICLADKFFSKSGDGKEKSLGKIRKSMEKFGAPGTERFEEFLRLFRIA